MTLHCSLHYQCSSSGSCWRFTTRPNSERSYYRCHLLSFCRTPSTNQNVPRAQRDARPHRSTKRLRDSLNPVVGNYKRHRREITSDGLCAGGSRIDRRRFVVLYTNGSSRRMPTTDFRLSVAARLRLPFQHNSQICPVDIVTLSRSGA